MKKILCGAVVVGVTFLASAATGRADEQPAKTTKPAEAVPAPKPTTQSETTTTTTTTTRRRGYRFRRDSGQTYYYRGGRLSAFMDNLRGRLGR
jgi:hypothetical protein